MTAPRLTVAGIGNAWREDDGIGLALARAVAARRLEDVAVVEWCDADALTLAALLLETAGPLLLVDAAEIGLAPGGWQLVKDDDPALRGWPESASTHGFGLADALALARGLGRIAPAWIFAVQPAALDHRNALSEPLARALPELAQRLLQEIGRLAPVPERVA